MLLVELLLGFLGDLLLQIVGELVVEGAFQLGDAATHGRMRRVLVFALAGGVAGVVSSFVRPGLLVVDAGGRYAAIAGSAVVAGLVLGFVEARVLRAGRGAAVAGFLTGAGFSLAYAAVRHLMRV